MMLVMTSTRHPTTRWFLLALVAVGTFMSTLDASIVTVAMPTLTSAFGTSVATSQWFVLAYTFAVTVLLLPFGRLGDIHGRRRLYVFGVAVFSAGSLVCGVSVSALMLILARGLQGIGSAAVMSCGPALVTQAFPPEQRGKSLGFIGTAVAFGLLAGPVVGGFIIQHADWRWMFFINIPIGLALAAMLTTGVHGFDESRDGTLDVPGAILLTICLASFLTATTFGSKIGWSSVWIVALLLAAAAACAAFILLERSRQTPILDVRLFREREFFIGAIAGWANYAATMPIAVFVPFYLQNVLSLSPQTVGLVVASGPLTLAFVAPVVGSLSDRIGSRFLTSTGLLTAGVGLLMLRTLGLGASIWDVVWRLVLVSLGSAVFVSPNSSAVMGSVPRENLGVAGGVIALVRNLGMVCGVAVAGAIITTVQKSHQVTGELAKMTHVAESLGFLAGLKSVFLVSAIILLCASFLSAMRVRPGDREAFERMG